jgi:peptidoglycan/LPS O-acetylase OafA/YrhL
MALVDSKSTASVGASLAQHRNFGPGFNALRLVLAVLVLCWHSVLVTTPAEFPKAILNGLYRPFFLFRVPMFFCLSGFLLTGSIIRVKSLKVFLVNRVLRIFPSLWMEVFLTGFALGPLMTAYSLRDYFGDRKFFYYMLNLIGRVHNHLPGVFGGNVAQYTVNLSLWTLPIELKCYAVLCLLIASRLLFSKTFMLASVVALMIVKLVSPYIPLFSQDATSSIYLMESPGNQFHVYIMFSSFIVGCAAYIWRDHIPLNKWLFGLSVVSFFALTALGLASWLVPLEIGYATVWLGLLSIPRLPFFGGGDYSYGIYLYAFPIQQTIVHLFPPLRHWYWNIALALPLAIFAAYLSWNYIEKPILALRGKPLPWLFARFGLAGQSSA